MLGDVFAGLEPWGIPWALRLVGHARTAYAVSSVRRTPTGQSRLFRRARNYGHAFPVAPPGQSFHERGLAWDMVAPPEELRRLGRIWQSWGGIYGGEEDPIHFQLTPAMMYRGPEALS